MTIRALIDFLLDFDPDMEVAMLNDVGQFAPLCPDASELIDMEDAETGEKEQILLLCPCEGHEEEISDVQDSVNPILN